MNSPPLEVSSHLSSRLMRHLERFFYSYGQWVGSQPWPFTVLPLLLTIISGCGFVYFHSDDDIWDLYAPSNGVSRVEENALRPFEFASSTHHYRVNYLNMTSHNAKTFSLFTNTGPDLVWFDSIQFRCKFSSPEKIEAIYWKSEFSGKLTKPTM